MPIRYWNIWLDGAKPHVFVQEIDGLPAVDWLAGTRLAALPGFDGVFAGEGATRTLQPVWAPDGREIVFAAAANRDAMMREQVPSALYRVKFGKPAEPANRIVLVTANRRHGREQTKRLNRGRR